MATLDHRLDERPETEKDRLDRELLELLNELRVVLPGVQALFAFLLIVPFNDRFTSISDRERIVYLVALLASALACVLFITTPSFHRLRFRRHDKVQLLRIGNRCAIAGMVALAVAMVAGIFLVTEVMFGAGIGVAVAASIAVPILVLWWFVPIVFGPDREGDVRIGAARGVKWKP
jgi:amino acid transporter